MENNYKNPKLSIDQRVEDLLSRMTLTEKIGQLTQVSAKTTDVQKIQVLTKSGQISSRVMASTALAGNEAQDVAGLDASLQAQKTAVEQSPLGVPLMDGQDVIHGYRVTFPVPLAQAASWSPSLVEKAAEIAAKETYATGVRWTFSPMLDIARDPRWGRIIEGYGEDPYLCSRLAQACVRGYQGKQLADQGRIAACAKHYVGYGMSQGGRDYSACDCSEHELRNTYLPPFKAAVEAGVATVMASFNEIGGEPVSASHKLLTDILKNELGFEGFVVSDWFAIQQLINQGVAANRKDAACLAFNAGIDMDMLDMCYSDYMAELVEEGRVSMQRLDDAVRRILRIKFSTNLFDDPYFDPSADATMMPADLDCALRLTEKSMVLLKNKANILPLAKKGKKIAVVGPLAEARRPLMGSWTVNKSDEGIISVVEGIRNAAPEAEIITTSTLADEMLIAARKADTIVLVLGESDVRNGEYACVSEPVLPVGQMELLRALRGFGKPIVTVICAGRPLAIQEVDLLSNAVLYAWHPGHLGGAAVANILFGDVNPSGKLPVSFPRNTGQIPIYYNHKPNARIIDEYYKEAPTDYMDSLGSPLYPFGYGLSYTNFTYSDFSLDKTEISPAESVTVSVKITNSGKCAGDEVVQCYIRDRVAAMTRPVRELKGFERVSLQPGESTIVSFALDKNSLSYYGVDNTLVLEPGEFSVWVGGDCLTELGGSFCVKEG